MASLLPVQFAGSSPDQGTSLGAPFGRGPGGLLAAEMERMILNPALRSAADDPDLDLDHAAWHPEKYG
jgi:hypothetical protein